jgi:hypothetical protein
MPQPYCPSERDDLKLPLARKFYALYLIASGYSAEALCERYACSPGALHDLARRHGVQRPDLEIAEARAAGVPVIPRT